MSSPSSKSSFEIPTHIAIIMDGNGRWAKKHHYSIAQGHKEGGEAVQRCVKEAIEQNIPYLTLYAFSSENWKRSEDEVGHLISLLRFYVRHKLDELHQMGVRLRIIGEIERFGKTLSKELLKAEEKTVENTKLTLVLALSYGGRAEILEASKKLIKHVLSGERAIEEIDESVFNSVLRTYDIPDPDIIVRTSGEQRLSNFLLWQSAYAELCFLDVLWPDFEQKHFMSILKEYAGRQRRFGARPCDI